MYDRCQVYIFINFLLNLIKNKKLCFILHYGAFIDKV
jgi:hypothetical protein